jgi:CubicO group peptidase (beta-lactamase class C family)
MRGLAKDVRMLVAHTAALLLGFLVTGHAAIAASHDELQKVAPESVGIDSAAVTKLTEDIRAGKYSNIHSLLVLRSGKLAVEEYFHGEDERRGQALGNVQFDATTLHDVRSVTKSVTAALFGIAVASGAIRDIEAPVLSYFPEYKDLHTPERLRIRLRDVLSMASGLQWDEESRPYGDPLNSETSMDAAKDRCRYVLSRPIAAAPGEKFRYSGGDTLLLAAVLERVTKLRLDKYADQVLFRPLRIEHYEWIAYPDGTPIAASGLRLLPRDMAKFGLLYQQRGQWRGTQIVPETWVKASLTSQTHVADRPFGPQNYGYQWWLGTARDDAHTPWMMAVGYGGQRIMLIPSLDLVMVMTAGMYGDRGQTDIAFEVLLDGVLPALKR